MLIKSLMKICEDFRREYAEIRKRYDENDPNIDHNCQASIRGGRHPLVNLGALLTQYCGLIEII